MNRDRSKDTVTGQLVVQLADAVERPNPSDRLLGVLDALDVAMLFGTATKSGVAYAVAHTMVSARGWPEAGSTAEAERDLRQCAHVLAMAALQSTRYSEDPEYREAVDNVLLYTLPRAPTLAEDGRAWRQRQPRRAEGGR